MFALAVILTPRYRRTVTIATSATAGRLTVPPSPGGAETESGNEYPKAWSRMALMKPPAPTATAAEPTVNSSTRSQPMTNAISWPSVA